jgi:hypothetical protein
MTIRQSAEFAWAVPGAAEPEALLPPDDGSSGAAPQSRAQERSLRSRLVFSPAATSRASAVSVPTRTWATRATPSRGFQQSHGRAAFSPHVMPALA